MKKKKGFTLIEMIAVIAIIGITGALVFTLFGKTHKVFSTTEKESRNIDEIRLVLSVLEEDIRLADKEKNEEEKNISIVYSEEYEIESVSIKVNEVNIIYKKNNSQVTRNDTTLGREIKSLKITPESTEKSKSYKITVKDKNDIEYETIVTRRK